MSLQLSAQTGTEITPAQLLGTEAEDKQTRIEDAQRGMTKLLRKMSKAGLSPGNRKQIVQTMQAAAASRTPRKALSHG